MGYFKNLINAVTGQSFDLSRMSGTEIDEFLRISGGNQSISGVSVNPDAVMRVAAAWRCIHLIAGTVATMPRDLIERVDENTREPAEGHNLRHLITVKPNQFQTPKEFFEMQTAWIMLRGNCYALKVMGVGGRVTALIPLPPPSVVVKEKKNGDLEYEYTTTDGKQITFQRDRILHVKGLSLDGKTGLSTLSYMRESIALAIDGEVAAATLMKNGSFVDGVITHPEKMSKESYKRLADSWAERRQGVDNTGSTAILEEGATLAKLSMTSRDLQFIEQRSFQKYDICMFYGVPPHMIGLTEKTTSWGSGIEQMNIGFVNYTLNNYLVSWQEALKRDCLLPAEQETHDIRWYTQGLLKGDTKTRWDSYTRGRQWGIYSANDIRAMEDMNPRTDPEGDEYAVPPNETKDEVDENTSEETSDDNSEV